MVNKLEVSLPLGDDYFDFDVPGFAEVLEKAYIETGYRSSGRAKVSFAPSGIGYGSGRCSRQWFYKFTGDIPEEDEKDALAISNMAYGTEAHERIQKVFEKAGILIEAEREIDLVDGKPPIRGFVDLIVDWNGEAVGEIKTTKQEAFTLRKAEGKPLDYHVIQLLLYMKVLKIDRGFILYECKNTGEWLIFPVMMDAGNAEVINQAFDWMIATREAFESGELPQRPFEKASKECGYCAFKKYCWKEDGDGEVFIPALQIT